MTLRSKKSIGNGLQFFVYKNSKRRVIKIPTTHSQKISILKKWGEINTTRLNRKVRQTTKITESSIRGLKKIINKVDQKIIGNPIFLKHPIYEQDFVTTIGKYFLKHSSKENHLIIDNYIDNIIQTWRYGFSDIVFNFTINNGTKNDSVILLDIGELTFSKRKIEGLIRRKIWLKRWSYLTLKTPTIKKYFSTKMNSNINLKTLNKNWRKAI